jgi:O-antigen/teichoic acid export membrane protein
VVMPIVVGGNLFAPEILSGLFGAGYAGGAPVLRIMLLTLPIVAVAESMRRLLLASASAGLLVAGFAVTATVHVALALAWVPQWSAAGAAAACFLGEAVGTATLAWIVRRLLGGLGWDGRVLVAPAAGLVAALVAFAAQHVGVVTWQATLLAAATYCMVAVAAGAVSRTELHALVGQLRRAGRWRVEMPD